MTLLVCVDMASARPLIALACFCERILQEKDGVMSAIRIVDTYNIPPLPPNVTVAADAVRGLIVLSGLISVKADTPMKGNIHLIMHKVTGETSKLSPPD